MDENNSEIRPVQEAQPVRSSSDTQHPYRETTFRRFVRFMGECRRVMKVIQKPNREEFIMTVKVSAIGLSVIGLIGFVLSIIQQLIL